MNRKFIILILLYLFQNNINAQKINTGYIIQPIIPYMHDFYRPYRGEWSIEQDIVYYIASEKQVLEFLKKDSVYLNETILLCDNKDFPEIDSLSQKYHLRYMTSIKEFLILEDSEIYEIGKKTYVIKKIEYAYLDNVKLLMPRDLWKDDFSEGEIVEMIDVAEYHKVNYYQYFLYIVKQIPTSKKIRKYMKTYSYKLGLESKHERFRPTYSDHCR